VSVIDSRGKNHIPTGSSIDREFSPDLFSNFSNNFQASINAILEDMGLPQEAQGRIPTSSDVGIVETLEPRAPISYDDADDSEAEEEHPVVFMSDEPLDASTVEEIGYVKVPDELQDLFMPSRRSAGVHVTAIDAVDFDQASKGGVATERQTVRAKGRAATKTPEDILAGISPIKEPVVSEQEAAADSPIKLPKATIVDAADMDTWVVPKKRHKSVRLIACIILLFIVEMLVVGYLTSQGIIHI
jgi:hypothetical protein